jgi:hypothetical protein
MVCNLKEVADVWLSEVRTPFRNICRIYSQLLCQLLIHAFLLNTNYLNTIYYFHLHVPMAQK